ncbi:MAG: ATP-binding protein [Clostridia bacterium]|nr:ATP-binding protein [Clostridia bacterium]
MINCEYLNEQAALIYGEYERIKESSALDEEDFLLQNESYSDLKYKLRSCVFDLKKAAFFNEKDKIEELEKERVKLTGELEKLKKTIPKFSGGYVPKCPVCNDTGFVDGFRCNCYMKTLNSLAYKMLGVRERRLYRFSDNAFGDVKTLKYVNKFSDYCKNFYSGSKNLLLLGPRGTGKTFLAECVASALNESGKNALFINAFEFNDVFIRTKGLSFKDQLVIKEILTGCDLLVIDDLGAAAVLNKITAENLLMIISERRAAEKPFIVTTNLDLDEIADRFGERVFSRLCARSTAKINFDGKDLRL